MDANGCEWMGMDRNGSEWIGMDRNGSEWMRMAENARIAFSPLQIPVCSTKFVRNEKDYFT
jgi:hypothetical protein